MIVGYEILVITLKKPKTHNPQLHLSLQQIN